MYNDYSGSLKVDLLAASLRANAADIDIFLETLANKLSSALPGQTTVNRHFGLGQRPIKELIIAMGEHQYRLFKDRKGPLLAFRSKVVRGIVLKTDPLTLDQWIDELSLNLAQLATQSSLTRAALERFLL